EALDRLHLAGSDFPRLAEVLVRRIDVEDSPAARTALALRLASLEEEQLGRPAEAIEAYLRALELEPGQPDALQGLARLYERQARWPELLDTLRVQVEQARGPAECVPLMHRSGAIYERELDDVVEALVMYENALELDPAHEPSIQALVRISHLEEHRAQAAELLEPRLRAQERWNGLAELLQLKADAALDPLGTKLELRALADVHEHGRQDPAAAFQALARALAEDPSDLELAGELERVARLAEDMGRLADVLEARAAEADSPEVARAHFQRLARLAETDLGDDARAVQALARALEHVGDDPEILAGLDRLHGKLEAWPAQAEVIERRVEIQLEAEARHELLVRLGALRAERFGDLRGALSAFREVLAADATDARAIEGLEALGRHEELALEVAETLEDAYRESGATERIAGLYDLRLRLAETDEDRVRMLREAAHLWESDLGNAAEAAAVLRRAALLDPRDGLLVDEVERLATLAGDPEPLRGLAEALATSPDLSAAERQRLHLRAAGWYDDVLLAPESAEAQLRAAIGANPEAPEAHALLAKRLREPEREAELAEVLSAWADVELDPIARRERLREVAALQGRLGRTEASAEALEALLELEADDLDALDALADLRAAQEHWPAVITLLGRRIDLEPGLEERQALRRRLASIHGTTGDADAAMETLERLLEESPDDRMALQELEALYRSGRRMEELRELLDRRLTLAATAEE
ncbi:MAG: tetratricopeptide repeat protein, partial [Myxococcota bacterium]